MATSWKLKSFLQAHHITPNALAERVKGRVSKTAIYNLVRQERPTSVQFDTLDALLPALSEMTKQKVVLNDIMDYEPAEAQVAPWMALAGSWDDPDSPGDISARHDHYLDAALNQEHEESLRGER